MRTALTLALVLLLWGCQRTNPPEQPKSAPAKQPAPKQAAPVPKQPKQAAPVPKQPVPASDKLALRLAADKKVYEAGEPLDLRLFLDNGTSKKVTVMRRASHVDSDLRANDGSGQFITSTLGPPPAPPGPPTQKDLAVIEPGKSLELRSWQMLDMVNRQIRKGNGNTGSFALRATYHAGSGMTTNLKELDLEVWNGILESAPVTIEIRD